MPILWGLAMGAHRAKMLLSYLEVSPAETQAGTCPRQIGELQRRVNLVREGIQEKEKRRWKSFVEVVELSFTDGKLWLAWLGVLGRVGQAKCLGKTGAFWGCR